MAYNPFLSMNEPAAPVTTEVLNPFMMSESETSNFTPGDNPFATSNPFSDFENSYEPPVGDTVPVDIFVGAEPTGIGAKQFDETNTMDVFGNLSMDNERLVKPTELELVSTMVDCSYAEDEEVKDAQLPSRPLPPETQNLILSVTGQMEFASSHLLDRIPPTRTPSPVSVRDIHSPSPTPEPDLMEENSSIVDGNRNKPARPPPARPPRPAPPPRPQPPPVTTQAVSDDINLFDAPAPTVVKPTKEAILSLYSAPKKEEKQIDFLSDDIPEMTMEAELKPVDTMFPGVTSSSPNESSNLLFNQPDSTMTVSMNESEAQNFAQEVQKTNIVDDTVAPMDCSEPSVEMNAASLSASPFADITDDSSYQTLQGNEHEKNPFEFSNASEADTSAMKSEDVIMASNTEVVFDTNETFITTPQSTAHEPQMDVFGTMAKDTFAETQTNIFGTEPENIQIDQPASNTDLGWNTNEAMVQDAFPESQDAFDAFSAKFDSTGGNHMNTGKINNLANKIHKLTYVIIFYK